MNDNAQSGNAIQYRWRLRDTLAAVFLFLGSAGFVWWQNARAAVLWDLGYLLDTSWRIALGQMPYRDFPLAHAPLTFLLQAGLMRGFGRHYEVVVVYAALAGGVGTLLAWRILLCVLREVQHGWWISFVLAMPLIVLGVYAIYPHPIYDCDCAVSILLAVWLLLRAQNWNGALIAGAACVLPVFFKQNMGLPFLGAVIAAIGLCTVAAWWRRAREKAQHVQDASGAGVGIGSHTEIALGSSILAGVGAGLCVAGIALASTAGIGNYIHWTVQFAAQRRMPGFAPMLSVYEQPSLVWAVPLMGAGFLLCFSPAVRRVWGRVLAAILIAAPLIAGIMIYLRQDNAEDRADTLLAVWPLWMIFAALLAITRLWHGIRLQRMAPLILLAAIHGAFMSQQLWGSTYALWALFFILIGAIFANLPRQAQSLTLPVAMVCCVTFGVCGALYSISLERLSYIDLSDGQKQHSHTPALRAMVTPGPYLKNLDELVSFTQHEIPVGDPLLVLPGEDPFFYATGRTPQFPVTLFDPATDPYNAQQLMDEVHRCKVRWVIVKRDLQIRENPMPDREETMRRIGQEFQLFRRLAGYEIYRAR